MMRAVLTNLGSMGNVQPFCALAQELKRYGHRPLLALAPQFAGYASELDLEFAPVGLDLDYADLQRCDMRKVLAGVPPVQILRDSLQHLEVMLEPMYEQLLEYCRGADVLIGGHLQPAARAVHETIGIPFVSVHTNHFGGMQPREIREASCSVINPFRARHGLPPITDPVHTDANSPQLALYAITRYLRVASTGWPPHWHVTGAFFLEETTKGRDEELESFLAAGEPPVVITFGSVAHPDPRAITAMIANAIDMVGCRAIVQRGWGGLGEALESSSRVFVAEFVQHSSLFPRAACVVHAGGSGTTTAALRAGVPAVVVPSFDDQPMWGELVRGIGCASAVIPVAELTAAELANAIQRCLIDPTYRRNALNVAEKIRTEGGVSNARILIENHVARMRFASQSDAGARVSQRSFAIATAAQRRARPAPARETYE